MPCSKPSWDKNLSIQNMLRKCGESKPVSPCPLPEPWSCPPYWETSEHWQPYPPCRQTCYQQCHTNDQKTDFKTKKILSTFITLPGFFADTFLKGQIVL
ncbi:unnamed protein product [Arctia plantaginis]|uniref:Uncharacterized protein n=1 Tax=Arctia plantaginis TaxID=874455 RepID=A0A8S1B318_ARCPL|nr:unnamed protein product [Arctia plantaginis]